MSDGAGRRRPAWPLGGKAVQPPAACRLQQDTRPVCTCARQRCRVRCRRPQAQSSSEPGSAGGGPLRRAPIAVTGSARRSRNSGSASIATALHSSSVHSRKCWLATSGRMPAA
jgi:hypothetical protein